MTRIVQLLLRGVIRLYQLTLSPLLGPSCRFAPSCSEYAMEAIAAHGPLAGLWLAAKRIVRCHPWGGSGFDPVPSLLISPEHNHTSCSTPSAARGPHS